MFINTSVWLLTPIFYLIFLISVSEIGGKYNQEHFALTLPKTSLPGIKKRSGSSELKVPVPVSIEKSL